MTNFNKVFAYLAASLAILLPVPGRIAYGIFVLVHFNLLLILTSLLIHGLKSLKLESLRLGIIAMEIAFLTVLYRQLLTIFCPVASLTLGFSLFLPSVSSVIIILLISHKSSQIKQDCIEKLKSGILISLICILIFIIRDIIGFATITLPGWQQIIVIKLSVLNKILAFGTYIATIPGCMLLGAVCLLVYTKIAEWENKNA